MEEHVFCILKNVTEVSIVIGNIQGFIVKNIRIINNDIQWKRLQQDNSTWVEVLIWLKITNDHTFKNVLKRH
jgi:hypothetical protein